MKISTERALQPAASARDVLHRIAWAADGLDPELAAVAIGVLTELEAAEAEIERLKMEAADRSAVSAEQIALPIRERAHLAGVGFDVPELSERGTRLVTEIFGIKIIADDRVPDGVLRIVGGA